ncbi:DUF4189 domain-containing protein [Nocardia panacis]|uniref:DUF4189 domain-containing protein n=1 Tax=Nocardia panacis TaxID=2340916 RepID=A0A3A4K5S4_9NOCA|nr:DUF4189 domain-containing protein [Nocardia panacis]RJO68280.1 DUF4189 domain-containing protein [Nocardia panacis]
MSLLGRAALIVVASAVAGIVDAGGASAEPGADGRLYGAMAVEVVGDEVHTIWASDFPSWADADASVLGRCSSANCNVIVRFVDGCGSIAAKKGAMIGRSAPTKAEAEQAAVDAFGPPVTSFSAAPPRANILRTECTSNAE